MNVLLYYWAVNPFQKLDRVCEAAVMKPQPGVAQFSAYQNNTDTKKSNFAEGHACVMELIKKTVV